MKILGADILSMKILLLKRVHISIR